MFSLKPTERSDWLDSTRLPPTYSLYTRQCASRLALLAPRSRPQLDLNSLKRSRNMP
eukprot:COSAG06_NODE_58905_length_275_cov_2.051136_1_plen_56_part_01